MRARIEIAQADIVDLHPEIPASARIIDVESVSGQALIVSLEWDEPQAAR